MEEKFNIWRWLFYGSLSTIMIWVILKSMGVIQTPAWLEYGVPITGAIIGFLSFHKEILESINKINMDLSAMKMQINHLEKDMELVKRKINVV